MIDCTSIENIAEQVLRISHTGLVLVSMRSCWFYHWKIFIISTVYCKHVLQLPPYFTFRSHVCFWTSFFFSVSVLTSLLSGLHCNYHLESIWKCNRIYCHFKIKYFAFMQRSNESQTFEFLVSKDFNKIVWDNLSKCLIKCMHRVSSEKWMLNSELIASNYVLSMNLKNLPICLQINNYTYHLWANRKCTCYRTNYWVDRKHFQFTKKLSFFHFIFDISFIYIFYIYWPKWWSLIYLYIHHFRNSFHSIVCCSMKLEKWWTKFSSFWNLCGVYIQL